MGLRKEHKTRQGGVYLLNKDGSLTRLNEAAAKTPAKQPEVKKNVNKS